MGDLFIDVNSIKGYIADTFQPDDLINLRWKYRAGKAGNELFKVKDIDLIIKKIEKLEAGGEKDSRKEVVAYWINAQHIKQEFFVSGKKSISDQDIDRYIQLPFDFDAEKPEGVSKDNNSTDIEKEAAKKRMEAFVSTVNELGWNSPLIVDSGNGYQARYNANLEVSELPTIKQLFFSTAMNFGSDRTTFNPGRVLKLVGTPTRKGLTETPERPYRMSKIVSKPNDKVPVTLEQIKTFLSKYPVKEEKQESGAKIDYKMKETPLERAKRLLSEWKIAYEEKKSGDGKTILAFADKYCPNSKSHTTNGVSGAAVVVSDKIGFKCQHDHCSKVSWHDMRMQYDPIYRRNKSAPKIIRDTNVVDWILENYSTHICFVTTEPEKGTFYIFNGKYMEPDTQMISRRFIEDRARELYKAYEYQLLTVWPATITNDKGEEIESREHRDARNRLKESEKYLDARCQKELWNLIKTRLTRRVKEFNKDKRYMCLNNGIMDLETLQLLPHDARYNISMYAPVDFIPGANCPKYDSLLEYQFPTPEERRYIMYIFGVSMLRQIRKDCSNIYFFGAKDTGKSTLLMAVIGVLGDASKDSIGYAITRSPDYNTMRAAKRETRNDKLQTRDRCIIGIDETRKDEKQDAESIKNSSGGAVSNARGLYQADEGLEPTATTINTCNELPPFDFDDDALISRLILIKFSQVLPNIKKDKPYWEELVKEESSGIFNRLIEAIRDYKINGPPPIPARFEQDKLEALGEADKTAKYIRNYCKLGNTPAHRMSLSGFYSQLEKFYTNVEHVDKKYIPGTKKVLATLQRYGVKLNENVTRIGKGTARNVLIGIREKTPEELADEDLQAWKADSEALHKEMPPEIIKALDKLPYKAAEDDEISNLVNVPVRYLSPVLEAMVNHGELLRDGPRGYALPLAPKPTG